MNLKKDRPSDNEILALIEQGKTNLQIIAELGTHSQRITQLRKDNGYIATWHPKGWRYGFKVTYTKGVKQKTTKNNKQTDSFILNYY